MKFVSIDTETTGLDPEKHNVIQFGAIIEDTNNLLPYDLIPKFEFCLEHSEYCGQAYALSMHPHIFRKIGEAAKLTQEEKREKGIIPFYTLGEEFSMWLKLNNLNNRNITAAGKNFGTFDLQFLKRIPNFTKHVQIIQRIIDPSMLYWDPIKDEGLPNLSACKKRAGLIDTSVAHDALADAWDVIKILRAHRGLT